MPELNPNTWGMAAIIVLAMREMIPALAELLGGRWTVWVQCLLALPVVLWAGWPFFQRGWTSLRWPN